MKDFSFYPSIEFGPMFAESEDILTKLDIYQDDSDVIDHYDMVK
jgi:hypothetical protein